MVTAFLGLITACDDVSEDSVGESAINISNNKYTFVQGPTMGTDYEEYLGYSAKVTGTLKNTSGKNWTYASVEFSIYDAEGNNMGTALDNINNLKSGDTWKFSADLFEYPDEEPVRFELVEVTYW